MRERYAVAPAARAYNAALKALVSKDPRGVFAFARTMRDDGVEATPVTNATLAHALARLKPRAALAALPALVLSPRGYAFE